MSSLKLIPCRAGSQCPSPVTVSGGAPASTPLVAAARHNGGIIPGVVMPSSTACHIPWGGQAIAKTEYFVLSNPGGAALVWERASHGSIPQGALQGGHSETGEPLYFGRFNYAGSIISGVVQPSHQVCYVPYWGQATSNVTYEVLCLKTVPLASLGLQ
ncbi:uncharacterized protein [Procambarus clarkii]|uniref:uncharacterized protein n=1 Tax=Procambarus clarkii TaxID=6728 RepID=UPI001E675239|nr:uncharacterized protein LOC123750610 [Procambarus clarkii]